MQKSEILCIGEVLWDALPAGLFLGGAPALAEAFECRTVCVTRGPQGAALWNAGAWIEHPRFRVEVQDTVGAGDAFLAALLSGLLAGRRDQDVLERASRVGAYVATQSGATPEYRRDAFEDLPDGGSWCHCSIKHQFPNSKGCHVLSFGIYSVSRAAPSCGAWALVLGLLL